MEPIKLKEEEIKELNDLRTEYSNVTFNLGDVEGKIMFLEMGKDQLKDKLKELSIKEQELVAKLESIYGIGNISLDTGEFSPIEQKINNH